MLFHRRAESFSATFRPNTFNAENRTVEVVWSTGATVRRSFLDGTPFDESLSMDARHVRMERLTSGAAPFLDSHRRESTADTLGVVERAWLDAATGNGHALIRFSERAEVAPIMRDVASGVLRNISVGYRIYRIEEAARQGTGTVPLYRAVDWEPYEISLVPVPADVGATTRSQGESYVCEVVRALSTPIPGSATHPAQGFGTQGQGTATDFGADRQRAAEILALAERHGMGSEWTSRHISLGTPLATCREAVLQTLEQRTLGAGIGRPATITQDSHDTFMRSAELALLERVRPGTLTDEREKELARRFRGKRMLQVFEAFLVERGVRTDGLLPSEIIERGFHTTTDFPLVLANVAKKTLRAAYAEMPQTWRPLVRIEELADFKEVARIQIGDAPKMQEKKEGAPVTYGKLRRSAGKIQAPYLRTRDFIHERNDHQRRSLRIQSHPAYVRALMLRSRIRLGVGAFHRQSQHGRWETSLR